MYEIRLTDGSPIYVQGDPDYAAYDIECSTEKGDSGYLKFSIPKSNPMWGKLVTRKSLVEFKLDGESIGIYEVRELTHDMQFDEAVYAVGELAWLFDSIQPQAEFHDISPREFLRTLLSVHNAQCPEHQFKLGMVDVQDPNDSLYRYTNRETTLDDIRDKLVDRLGGQIRMRKVNGERILDYVTDATYGSDSTQRIYFGENLMDYSDTMTVDEICSSVVPLGCRLENSPDNKQIGNLELRLTVESVNGGRDYVVDQNLVNRFGNVRTSHVWDDVTVPANLLDKAQRWLKSDQFEKMHLTLKAVDLSLTSDQFARLRLGDTVTVVAPPYGLNRRFPITKRTYHPAEPDSDLVELGDTVKLSYIKSMNAQSKALANTDEDTGYRQTKWLTEAIENVTAMMTGDRGGYKFSEYDDDGRWLADYYLDSADKETAQVVHKVNLNGDAYSTNGIEGPYETAIMANGMILGKYIMAHSIKAEQISQDYTAMWEDADTQTLKTARTEFKAADAQISAKVTQVERTANNVKTDLAAEVRIRADQISQTVKRGQINSSISQTAETIYIRSNHFGWDSSNSSLATDGTLKAKYATFTSCTVNGDFECAAGATRVTMKGGVIDFYGRKYSDEAWKKGVSMKASLSSDGSPSLLFRAERSSEKAEMTMWQKEIIVSVGIPNGTSKKSDLQLRKEWARLDSGTGTNNVSLDIAQSNAEFRVYTDGIYRSGLKVSNGRVDITGNLYVNGTKIN